MDPYDFEDHTSTVIKIKRRCTRNGKVQKAVCVINVTSKKHMKISLDKVMERHMAYHSVLYPYLPKQQIKGLTLKYLGLPNSMGDIPRTPGKAIKAWCSSGLAVNNLAMFNYSKLLRQFVNKFHLRPSSRQSLGYSISEKTMRTTITDTSSLAQSLSETEDESVYNISDVSSDDEWQPVSKKQRRGSVKGHTSVTSFAEDGDSVKDLPNVDLNSSVSPKLQENQKKKAKKTTSEPQTSSPRVKSDRKKLKQTEIKKLISSDCSKSSGSCDEETVVVQEITKKKEKGRPKILKSNTVDEKNQELEAAQGHKEVPLKITKQKINMPKAGEKQKNIKEVGKTVRRKGKKATVSCEDGAESAKETFDQSGLSTPVRKTIIEQNQSFDCITRLFQSPINLDKTKILAEITEEIPCVRSEGKIDMSFTGGDFTTTLAINPHHDTVQTLMLSSASETSYDSSDEEESNAEELGSYEQASEDNSEHEQIALDKPDEHEPVVTEDVSEHIQVPEDNPKHYGQNLENNSKCNEEVCEDKPDHNQQITVDIPELEQVPEETAEFEQVIPEFNPDLEHAPKDNPEFKERDAPTINMDEKINSKNMQIAEDSAEKCDSSEQVSDMKTTAETQNKEKVCATPGKVKLISKEKKNYNFGSRMLQSTLNTLEEPSKLNSIKKRKAPVQKKLTKKKLSKTDVDTCIKPQGVLQEITINPLAKEKNNMKKKCSEGMTINSPSVTENQEKLSPVQEKFENEVPVEVKDTSDVFPECDNEIMLEKAKPFKKRKVSVGIKLQINVKANNEDVENIEDVNDQNSPEIIPGTPTSEDSIETRLKELQRKLDEAGTPESMNSTDSSTIQVSITPKTAQIIENSDDEEEGKNEIENSSDDEMESLFSKKTNKSFSKLPGTPRSCYSTATADSLVFNRYKSNQKSRAKRVPLNLPHINPATKVSRFLSGLEGSGNSQESYLSTSTDLTSSVEQAEEVGQSKSPYAASECSVRSVLANLFDPIDDAGSRTASRVGSSTVDSVASSPDIPAIMQPPVTRQKRFTRK